MESVNILVESSIKTVESFVSKILDDKFETISSIDDITHIQGIKINNDFRFPTRNCNSKKS